MIFSTLPLQKYATIVEKKKLTRPTIKGAKIEPTRPAADAIPMPEFRTSVGKSSAPYTYTMENMPAAPNFPNRASTTVAVSMSVGNMRRGCSLVWSCQKVAHATSPGNK